jgi:hypothetical protein
MIQIACFAGNMSWREINVAFGGTKETTIVSIPDLCLDFASSNHGREVIAFVESSRSRALGMATRIQGGTS